MMVHSYDWHGYLSDAPIPDRATDVAPPPEAEWPTGKRPNWSGYAWVYLDYPPVIARPVPEPISRRQFHRALYRSDIAPGHNMLDAVVALVAEIGGDLAILWATETEFHRDSAIIIAMIDLIGATPEQADAVWMLGATL